MSVRVIYSTEAFLHKNGDHPGMQCERSFASIDEAKKASLPDHCVFAFIQDGNDQHVYSTQHGWEFIPCKVDLVPTTEVS